MDISFFACLCVCCGARVYDRELIVDKLSYKTAWIDSGNRNQFACNKRSVDKCREDIENASNATLKTYFDIWVEVFQLQSVLRGRVRPVYCIIYAV